MLDPELRAIYEQRLAGRVGNWDSLPLNDQNRAWAATLNEEAKGLFEADAQTPRKPWLTRLVVGIINRRRAALMPLKMADQDEAATVP